MPDETSPVACSDASAVVVGDQHAVDDPLSCHDLVGAHHQERVLGVEHAVAGENIEDGSFREEGTSKRDEVGNAAVLCQPNSW